MTLKWASVFKIWPKVRAIRWVWLAVYCPNTNSHLIVNWFFKILRHFDFYYDFWIQNKVFHHNCSYLFQLPINHNNISLRWNQFQGPVAIAIEFIDLAIEYRSSHRNQTWCFSFSENYYQQVINSSSYHLIKIIAHEGSNIG